MLLPPIHTNNKALPQPNCARALRPGSLLPGLQYPAQLLQAGKVYLLTSQTNFDRTSLRNANFFSFQLAHATVSLRINKEANKCKAHI